MWLIVYEKYLLTMHNILIHELNKYKASLFNKIEFKDFLTFAFNHSSQYISAYA